MSGNYYNESIEAFAMHLWANEKTAMVEKYMRNVRAFQACLAPAAAVGRGPCCPSRSRETVIAYKSYVSADQFVFGILRIIRALILSLFLEIHQVFLRKSAFIRTQILSQSALAE